MPHRELYQSPCPSLFLLRFGQPHQSLSYSPLPWFLVQRTNSTSNRRSPTLTPSPCRDSQAPACRPLMRLKVTPGSSIVRCCPHLRAWSIALPFAFGPDQSSCPSPLDQVNRLPFRLRAGSIVLPFAFRAGSIALPFTFGPGQSPSLSPLDQVNRLPLRLRARSIALLFPFLTLIRF
jgi:hypothetical protein